MKRSISVAIAAVYICLCSAPPLLTRLGIEAIGLLLDLTEVAKFILLAISYICHHDHPS